MSQVKICGLTRTNDIETAILYGADYLGFIIEAKSKRSLSAENAGHLARPAKNAVPIVAVTVNPDDNLLMRLSTGMQPDYIQLHGDETPARVSDIQNRFGFKVIKALPISKPKDIAAIFAYQADLILLDAKPPKDGPRGGHGKAFDWTLLDNALLPDTWILAGGLTPANVRKAARQTAAPILDVSSGVESAAGIKDPAKLKALLDAVKAR